MAQVLIGKELPNLKITLGNDKDSMEEGELSESDYPATKGSDFVATQKDDKVSVVRKWSSPLHKLKVYENKGGAFITGLDLSSEVVKQKLEERASRFGLSGLPKIHITQAEIDALYKSMDINEENGTTKNKNIRLDAVHIRGVEDMSTNEVFEYFKEFGPASVEWINDYSCNVVWLDEISAARALLSLSKAIVVRSKSQNLSKTLSHEDSELQSTEDTKSKIIEVGDVIYMSGESSDEDDDEDKLVAFKHRQEGNPSVEIDSAMEIDEAENETHQADIVDRSAVNVPVPPGHWRLGVPHERAKAILLRFATKDDKKLPGAEKRSQYYKKYGNPNYGGLRGLISKSRKRKIQAYKHKQLVEHLSTKDKKDITNSGSSSEEEEKKVLRTSNKSKRIRMRMYADDEEKKIKKRKALTQYSVFKNHFNKDSRSVHDRLGRIDVIYRTFNPENDGVLSNEDEHETEQSLQKISTVKQDKLSKYNIWTNLAKCMAEESEITETQKLKYPLQNNYSDLRNKLHSPMSTSSRYKYNTRSESNKGDLRSKLEHMRRHDKMKHCSPLLIKIDTEDDSNDNN